jgi:PadR family transcriptional regulator, regulatory protein PadR
MPDYSKELVAASSIPLVLAILARGESYGYEIIKTIRESSEVNLNSPKEHFIQSSRNWRKRK